MKYVRTKDGIYEIEEEHMFATLPPQYIVKGSIGEGIQINNVISRSEDIEKLCDEFIVWEEDYHDPLTMSMSEKERYEQMKKAILLGLNVGLNCWMKLGIWTDKGLIYVAKMNEKGELELV